MPENRDRTGRFRPGVSPNPGGRPRGFARMIREHTGDGKELVDFALEVMRSSKHPVHVRLDAMKWLADRGFGRAAQPIEITYPDEDEMQAEVERLAEQWGWGESEKEEAMRLAREFFAQEAQGRG